MESLICLFEPRRRPKLIFFWIDGAKRLMSPRRKFISGQLRGKEWCQMKRFSLCVSRKTESVLYISLLKSLFVSKWFWFHDKFLFPCYLWVFTYFQMQRHKLTLICLLLYAKINFAARKYHSSVLLILIFLYFFTSSIFYPLIPKSTFTYFNFNMPIKKVYKFEIVSYYIDLPAATIACASILDKTMWRCFGEIRSFLKMKNLAKLFCFIQYLHS